MERRWARSLERRVRAIERRALRYRTNSTGEPVAVAQGIEIGFQGAVGPQGPEGPEGPQGDTGGTGATGPAGQDAGLKYSFDTATAMADPGTGDVRFNNATIASVTQVAISDTDDEANNNDAFLDAWDDSTSTVRGLLLLTSADGQVVVFQISGAITDQGTWHQVPVAYVSGTLFSADEVIQVQFYRTGDKGDTGATGSQGSQGDPGAPGAASTADWKDSCRVATTANIATATGLNNGDVIDGVTLATNDRVLVKDQSTASQNGIWVVGVTPARATDADAAGELSGGSTVYVEEGTLNGDSTWAITTNGSITPGTTAHTWTKRTSLDYICIRDEKASGTGGGGFTSGAWQTRTLNTETADTGGHASLAFNQITLAPGTYRVRASAPARHVDHHQAKLRNVTAGSDALIGTSEYSRGSDWFQTCSVIAGRITIAASTVFEIQHRCQTTDGSNGMGDPAGFGVVEVYTVAEFWRES